MTLVVVVVRIMIMVIVMVVCNQTCFCYNSCIVAFTAPNTDATPSSSLGLLPNQMSTSGAVVPAMTSAVNPGHMMTPFGGFPVLPAVPNPADMMSMMPYLFPCLTGFYPGAGMPFMPTSMVPGKYSHSEVS